MADVNAKNDIENELEQAIRGALKHIPADARDTWVTVGMAMHSVSPDLFDIWDQWSQTSDKYNASAARSVWKSFKYGPVSVASLFGLARDYGWQGTHYEIAPEVAQQRREEQQSRARAEAARRKWRLDKWWSITKNNVQYGPSPYLLNKGFRPDDFEPRQFQQRLLPAYNPDNPALDAPPLTLVVFTRNDPTAICGAQTITADGDKRTVYGSSMRGVMDIVPSTTQPVLVLLAEGLATKFALQLALRNLTKRLSPTPTLGGYNWRVANVAGASNLCKSAVQFSQVMHPDSRIVIVCDNDDPEQSKSTYEAVGTSEMYARRATGWPERNGDGGRISYIMPTQGAYGTDFADLFLEHRWDARDWLAESLKGVVPSFI